MGSRMIRVVGFLLANYQLHVPFRSEFKVRHMTDRQTNKDTDNGHRCIIPTLWGVAAIIMQYAVEIRQRHWSFVPFLDRILVQSRSWRTECSPVWDQCVSTACRVELYSHATRYAQNCKRIRRYILPSYTKKYLDSGVDMGEYRYKGIYTLPKFPISEIFRLGLIAIISNSISNHLTYITIS